MIRVYPASKDLEDFGDKQFRDQGVFFVNVYNSQRSRNAAGRKVVAGADLS